MIEQGGVLTGRGADAEVARGKHVKLHVLGLSAALL